MLHCVDIGHQYDRIGSFEIGSDRSGSGEHRKIDLSGDQRRDVGRGAGNKKDLRLEIVLFKKPASRVTKRIA
jgi:hypothetical protein